MTETDDKHTPFLVHSKSHCVKSVQIGSFFWSIFSCTWAEYGDYTDQKNLGIWTLFT